MLQKLRKEERRSLIMSELRASPLVRISALAEKFGVTTETIRRDLDALSKQGLVAREYGGASARPMGVQPPARERGRELTEERSRIGAAAAALVMPGEVLMIDTGSTTGHLARHLAAIGEDLTVVTNSYPVASDVSSGDARVVMCPGEFDPREGGVYGVDSAEYLRQFHANKAFIGASGISSDGLSDVNRNAVSIKRAMIERAGETYALVDHSKFGARLLESVGPLSALAGLITDQEPPAELRLALERAGVQIIVAEPQV
ncbi:DeoR/GlpR family DNA-binding transcription regulator [Telmatospirillum sp. J64-1]|uniref:DeoR/GlpR family DNA-binding transcription regulator n=1 Tax=Telmatospirillum sp. J64-1 TaxID=2502183 RepID=UPI00115C80D1|nr:DeoR/GlpR family DNA-binding transcription regulator [Telmatospirillum sp. J64-1]